MAFTRGLYENDGSFRVTIVGNTGGGGDATAANQEEEITALEDIVAAVEDTSPVAVKGSVAPDAAFSGADPLGMAARASTAAPSAMSDDLDLVPLWASRKGALFVNITAADALIPGDATNGLKVNVTNVANVNAEYETVAASQTAQVLGATGATGDYISHVVVIPATTSPGNILLLDNATSITIFTGGAASVSNLVPFVINLGMISVSGAWKLTTGANVSAIGVGNFT
jgi:hypothetical protein